VMSVTTPPHGQLETICFNNNKKIKPI
jgi:hypothetical protein